MSKLVFDATGKNVHPTCYRQMVETASTRHLSSSAQSTISEDQKHSSVVACKGSLSKTTIAQGR